MIQDTLKQNTSEAAPELTLKLWQHSLTFALAFILFATRRPDAILHPQFWAEDGHVWFADAYNLGWWNALFRAQDGYFQTFPRLAAAVALLVPISLAPLVLNIFALAAQALPINLLLSSRSTSWGGLHFRGMLAVVYVALPNCREMMIVVTSAQWLLALSAFLILVATPAMHPRERIFDLLLLVLCGLTGPFCLFLVLIAAFTARRRGGRQRWMNARVLLVLTFVQLWGLLIVDRSGRAHAILGASPALLTRILGGQIYLASLLGGNGLSANQGVAVFWLLICAALGGTAFITVCFVRSRLEMRLFLTLTAMFLVASLISPAAYPPPGVSRWELLSEVPGGIRYWFFPTLATAWSLIWAAHSRIRFLQAPSCLLLLIMCIGIIRDWKEPAFQDLHFKEFAARFAASPAGTVAVEPENPSGWNLRLVKRSF